MRRGALGERLEQLAPAEAAAVVQALVEATVRGSGEAQHVALALATWLVRLHAEGRAGRLEALRDAAREQGLAATAALLDDGPPLRELPLRGRLREDSVDEGQVLRLSSLPDRIYQYPLRDVAGQRFLAFAPTPVRHWLQISFQKLDSMLLTRRPALVRRVLRARWITLADVLRIASRRPTTAGIALEVATSDRWVARIEVREALAANPYTPTGVVLALLPTVRREVVERLRDPRVAHPLVAAAASAILDLAGSG